MTGIYLISALVIAGGLYINRNKAFNNILLSFFLVVQWAFTVYCCSIHKQTELQFFTPDSLGILFLITLSLIAIPAVIHGIGYNNTHLSRPYTRSIYSAALVLLITAITAGYIANNIAVIWIFTEITTLCASALIYHHRDKLSLEGTWKYVFICAISITFVFIGILFLSLSLQHAGSSDLTFSNLLKYADKLDAFWLRLAFLFIFTGFTAKLGLVPMFTAGIDAKDQAPAPAAALFSSVLVNLGFIGIFRFYSVVANTPLHNWANLIITIAAVLSVFIATVYMSKVKNIKRMLAYSGIEHMGLVMLGVAAGGIGYYAAILHLILHAFVKSALFFQFHELFKIYKSKNIYLIGNYFKYYPTGAIVLLIGFISATAMPPSGLFVSEFLIFRSLFEGGNIAILIVVLILLTIIIWTFGKTMFKILFTQPVDFDDRNLPKISPWNSLSQFILLFVAVWLGLNPPAIMVQFIQDAITVLPG